MSRGQQQDDHEEFYWNVVRALREAVHKRVSVRSVKDICTYANINPKDVYEIIDRISDTK